MLRKFKIQHRLIGTFLIVSIIPIIFLGIYSYQLYSKSISEKLRVSNFQAITLLNKNLLSELQNYQFLNGSISTNTSVQAYLSGDVSDSEKLQSKEAVMDEIFRTIFPSHVMTVSVFNANKMTFYELGYDTFSKMYLDQAFNNVDRSAPFDAFTYIKSNRANDTIAIGRKIHSEHDSSKEIGYSFVYVSADLFSKDILSSVDLGEGSELLVMDRDGILLSSSNADYLLGTPYRDPELIGNIKAQQQQHKSSFTEQISDSSYQVSYIYNSNIGLYLVSLIPYSYINSEISQITQSIKLMIAFIVFICILIISIMNRSIVLPITRIISFTQRVSNGELSQRIVDQHDDEMSVLARKINSMVNDIEQLLARQKEDDKRKRELELKMLQSQINPHFLFNTLNTLRWLAVINKVPVLNNGISSLAELLRSTILDRDELITFKQEIHNLNHYFEIQKIRYADRFTVEYQYDAALEDILLPKLILQPVAENAIIHGISEQEKSVNIRIIAYQENNHLHIEIVDDGKGFDVTKVSNINSNSKLSSIGIQNVNERIRLNYGEAYGLNITSRIGIGTTCKIIIPIQRKEEE